MSILQGGRCDFTWKRGGGTKLKERDMRIEGDKKGGQRTLGLTRGGQGSGHEGQPAASAGHMDNT